MLQQNVKIGAFYRLLSMRNGEDSRPRQLPSEQSLQLCQGCKINTGCRLVENYNGASP